MFPSSDLVNNKQSRHEIRAILLSFCEVVVAVKGMWKEAWRFSVWKRVSLQLPVFLWISWQNFSPCF